jgi:hypothetical protein
MSETATTTRPVRVLNEAVLMFVRITQTLNKRDDLNEKISRTSFYNDLDSAKAAARTLGNENGVGYLWMTKTVDTLKDDGSVDRVNHNFMWTKRNQWVAKPTKAYTISAEDVAKQAAGSGTVSNEPAADDNADF